MNMVGGPPRRSGSTMLALPTVLYAFTTCVPGTAPVGRPPGPCGCRCGPHGHAAQGRGQAPDRRRRFPGLRSAHGDRTGGHLCQEARSGPLHLGVGATSADMRLPEDVCDRALVCKRSWAGPGLEPRAGPSRLLRMTCCAGTATVLHRTAGVL